MKIKSLCIFGTRPEAIKMAPLAKSLETDPRFLSKVCVTGQHREMLDQVLNLFDLSADFDLNIMQPGQDLTDITTKILDGLKIVFQDYKPDIIFVHGDTTSALAGALAAYFEKIKIGHVEAGLRTNNIYSPWPEEGNRRLISAISTLNFAPTKMAKNNLLSENINEANIYITGNTVIDALIEVVATIDNNNSQRKALLENVFSFLDKNKKIILVTGHRRENFGAGFENICEALKILAQKYPSTQIVYPVHLNPNVREIVHHALDEIDNIFLIEPLEYLPFIYLMSISYIILTDSGGIQEEAPSLGKPVLVMRETTERPEAVQAGTVKIVGTNINKIVSSVSELLEDKNLYNMMSLAHNPYGDGKASQNITDITYRYFND